MKKHRKKPGPKPGFKRVKAAQAEDKEIAAYEMWETLCGIFRHVGYTKLNDDETRRDTLNLACEVLAEMKKVFKNEK